MASSRPAASAPIPGPRGAILGLVQVSAQGNLADAAVAAAMKYRVGAPLIDALMSEIGMAGSSVGGLLSGAAPSPTPGSNGSSIGPKREAPGRG